MELEQLAPYFPYGLPIKILNWQGDYVGKVYSEVNGYYILNGSLHVTYNGGSTGKDVNTFKPILKSLDHYKDICSTEMHDLNGDLSTLMVLCDLANRRIGLAQLSYRDAEYCFSEHIDVFRLVDKGLAIDFYKL